MLEFKLGRYMARPSRLGAPSAAFVRARVTVGRPGAGRVRTGTGSGRGSQRACASVIGAARRAARRAARVAWGRARWQQASSAAVMAAL